MKLKALILIAASAAPAWAAQVNGTDLLAMAAPTDSSSAGLLLAGVGLMATIARRRIK